MYRRLSPTQVALVGAIFIVAFALGAVAGYTGHTVPPAIKAVREEGYTYIRPILLCNVDPQPQNEDTALDKRIAAYVSGAAQKDIGVYYLNPTAGKWAGYHEEESFSPASMLKVPIMVAVLRQAEATPAFLQKQIYYDGAQDLNALEVIKPQAAIVAGRSYSVDELLTYMIKYSDNNAANLLQQSVSQNDFEKVFTDVGLSVPSSAGPVDFMSPKTFTLFLRLLYNSTYLSRELSEKALSLMAAPDFAGGLRGGVPATVVVSQKFGEREGQSTELHDCGIVYAQSGAYLLCVMTRGSDQETLSNEISDISRIIYDAQ